MAGRIWLYSDASLARAWASTRVPRAISSGLAYSSGRWLTPLRQGMKIMAMGAMLCHEERVVVGAADHLLIGDALFRADLFEKLDDVRGGLRGRVGVDEFFCDRDFAALAQSLHSRGGRPA